MNRRARAYRAGIFVFLAYSLCSAPPTKFNEHVRLAYALLHGHPWIDATPVHEMVRYGGHWYALHPPLPALVCLPFVALWGLATNQTAISVAVGALAAGLCWRLVETLLATGASRSPENPAEGVSVPSKGIPAAYLTLFFAFGTVFFDQATLGTSWSLCLTLSCVPTFLALLAVERGDALWTGVWAGTAALARYDLMLVLPIYWLMLKWKIL